MQLFRCSIIGYLQSMRGPSLLAAVLLTWLPLVAIHAESTIRFASEKLELRCGETAMVPLIRDNPAGERETPGIELSDSRILEIIREPEILPGNQTGFLRIRTLEAGDTTLTISGATLDVSVRKEPLIALVERMRPQITAPATGAAIWGQAVIGAEIWVGSPGLNRDRVPDALLLLPDGRTIAPEESMPPVDGPFWRLIFCFDCADLEPGRHDFAVHYRPELKDLDSGYQIVSEPQSLVVLADAGASDWIIAGECEDTLDTPRSDQLGSEPPGVGFDNKASNARFINLFGQRPEWVFRTDLPSSGHYQLMLRARGTLAASAYPSLELIDGKEGKRLGAGRLASNNWHRLAIGPPVQLQKGEQFLAIRLANDVNYRGRVNRDAFADCFELRRVSLLDSGSGSAADTMTGGGSMMMTMSGENSFPPPETPAKDVPSDLAIAFNQNCNGQTINGAIEVSAAIRAGNYRHDRDFERIVTSLLVNGRLVGSQRGRYPRIKLYPHDLVPGNNTLQLLADGPGGTRAESLEQTLILAAANPPEKPLPTQFREHRFALQQGKWRPHKPQPVAKQDAYRDEDAPKSLILLKHDQDPLVHQIADHFHGPHRISLHLHPPIGTHSAAATLELALDDRPRGKNSEPQSEPRILGTIGTWENRWQWVSGNVIDLPKGPKSLLIRSAEKKPDQVIAIGGISIGAPYFVDQAAPELIVQYPRSGSLVHPEGDAVVVSSFDDTGISHYQLWIDGNQSGLDLPPSDTGPAVLPWDTSTLAPGAHRLEVVAVDQSGKRSTAPGIPFTIPATLDSDHLTLPYPRAVRLAERIGFGPDRHSLATLLVQGEQAWIEEQLAATPDTPSDLLIGQLAKMHFPGLNDHHVRGRVLSEALLTRSPVRTRFVLWAQNHFSVWMRKAGSRSKWIEHEGFRGAGLARFNDLLLLSATSPAMMVYLDQQNSLDKQLNENYAREILELHTVGVDSGYDQDDVTALAHLLTGWGAQKEATMDGSDFSYRFRFSPFLNEENAQQVYGLSLDKSDFSCRSEDRILQLLEMLASRPEAAAFVSRKLLSHYFADDPPPALLHAIQSRFQETQGDFRELLRLIAGSHELMARELEPKILQPIEFGIVSQRMAETFHPWRAIDLAERSGRNLFDRSSPDGYPEENEEYAGSNYQLQKWRYAKDLEDRFGNHLPWRWVDEQLMEHADHRTAVARIVALHLTRHPAGSTSDAALQLIAHEAGTLPDHNQRRRLFATFTFMLPESQTR
jgi:hypothetical protein